MHVCFTTSARNMRRSHELNGGRAIQSIRFVLDHESCPVIFIEVTMPTCRTNKSCWGLPEVCSLSRAHSNPTSILRKTGPQGESPNICVLTYAQYAEDVDPAWHRRSLSFPVFLLAWECKAEEFPCRVFVRLSATINVAVDPPKYWQLILWETWRSC